MIGDFPAKPHPPARRPPPARSTGEIGMAQGLRLSRDAGLAVYRESCEGRMEGRREGLPSSRSPALLTSGGMDAGAQAASSERRPGRP